MTTPGVTCAPLRSSRREPVEEPAQAVARPTSESVRTRLAEAGIIVPDDFLAGTQANLVVLQDHVATLRAFALDPRSASALRFDA
jgi:hypothetical protein